MYGSPTERIAQAAWNSSDGTDHMCGRIQENYQYDRTGRLTAAISGGMRYDYRYDRKNQLLAKTAGGRTLVSYAYDAEGNRTASTDVTGNCTKYTYDLLGRMTGVRDDKTGFLATYEYTKAGDLKKVDTPVLHTAYAYDGDRNLTALRTMAAGDASVEKILADNTYRYNKNGQRTEKTTLAGTTKYTYDVLGQLIQENNHIYTYDRAGNRTSVQTDDRREIYSYDRGRLRNRTVERQQDPAGSQTYTYRYDAQGNTLSDGENTYLYDCLNRITEVKTKAGDIQKNHYDAEGLRSQMEENGKLVSFIYADREVITEEDEAGEHIRYIRGHELLASDSERARTYYHYACDEMGSITDITDCHGTVLNHYAYDAFGNRTVEEETVENRFGFAGEMLDAVTGQYYLRARFYNPVIARFLSEDTYYGDGLNLYAYCHNNPVGYVDPSGHLCEKKQYKLEQYKEYLKQGIDKKEAYQKANYDAIKKYNGLEAAERYRKSHQNTNPVYEQNQKKSNGAGSDSKSGRNTATTIDYSYKFDRELANFNDDYEIRTTVDKDLILVQYSSDAPDASLCYWTTIDEANGITTLNDYMDKLALSKDWGNRNTVKVARISAGTEVKYAVGTAREQLLIADPRPGGGVQYLFNQFDTDWITEIRSFSN